MDDKIATILITNPQSGRIDRCFEDSCSCRELYLPVLRSWTNPKKLCIPLTLALCREHVLKLSLDDDMARAYRTGLVCDLGIPFSIDLDPITKDLGEDLMLGFVLVKEYQAHTGQVHLFENHNGKLLEVKNEASD